MKKTLPCMGYKLVVSYYPPSTDLGANVCSFHCDDVLDADDNFLEYKEKQEFRKRNGAEIVETIIEFLKTNPKERE